jgi:hypothetical protein
MNTVQEDLARARVHVAEAERRVEEQRHRVSELARDGHSIDMAMRLLAVLEQSLQAMRQHLDTEERFARDPG